jgi:hypothetical protein
MVPIGRSDVVGAVGAPLYQLTALIDLYDEEPERIIDALPIGAGSAMSTGQTYLNFSDGEKIGKDCSSRKERQG